MRRRRLVWGTGLLVTALLSTPVWGYFAGGGQGTASASVGSITPATQVTAGQTGADLAVSWAAASLAPSGTVQGYRVSRSDGVVVCGSPTPVTALTCTDANVPGGTYSYTVTAIYHSFSAAAQSSPVSVLAAPTLASAPSDPSANVAPSFSFSGGGGTGYQCRLDAATVTTCASPQSYSGLTAGTHTFTVQATRGGAAGPATSATWTVDASAPTITAKPAGTSALTSPAFSFSHSRSAYTFTCHLDATAFAACVSPTTFAGVPDGSHTFQVEALGADGAVTAVASYTWLLDSTGPTSSFASAGGLVWANKATNAIGSAGIDGSNPNQSLVPGALAPLGVATDGSHLYWTNVDNSYRTPNTIGRANLDGTGVTQSFLTAPYAWAVAADAGHIYWTSTGYNTIARANTDGSGNNINFITGANGPVSVAVNGSYIYWANINNKTIGRANLDGTGVNQSFLTLATTTQGLAVDASHLYWTSGNAIARADLDGSSPQLTFIPSTGGGSSLAVDAGHIYWGTGGTTIGRANLDGSGVTTSFITGTHSVPALAVVPAPSSSAVSGTTVYFNSNVSGSLTLVDATTDAGSGPASVTFPDISTPGWTHAAQTVTSGSGTAPSIAYTSASFTWAPYPGIPSGYSVSATDSAGTASSTALTFVNDPTPPGGGVLTVNGTAASGSGTTSTAATTAFTIDGRTDFTEAQSATQSGLSSATLTVQSAALSGGVCGAPGGAGPFPSAVTVAGTTQPAGIVSGYCYTYALGATDRVGNAVSTTTTVQVS